MRRPARWQRYRKGSDSTVVSTAGFGMSHEMHIIKAGEFLRSGPTGVLDLDASRRVLKSLAETLVSRGVEKALLDVRKMEIHPPPTYTELYHLARAFQDAGFGPHHRLAVLVAPNRFDKAEFFALCASGRGWNAFAFDSFEDAFDWLTEEEPIETETKV
jgi:hypothetical protein